MAFMMPQSGIASVDKFDLEYVDSLNVLISGAAHATQYGEPYWDISMRTTNLTVASGRYQQWRSFLDSLQGSKKPGYFFDPKKPYPAMYMKTKFTGLVVANTTQTFTGDAYVQSFVNRSRIVVEGLPAGFQLKRSDYVSFIKGDNATLHRLIADVTAGATGVATINVEPRVPTAYDGTSTVRFAYAPFKGIMNGTPTDNHDIESGQIAFKARSVAVWAGGSQSIAGWILENGIWDSSGVWIDSATW